MHCNVSQDLFIKEFIERDLKAISTLDQLVWKIRGNRLNKEQVEAFLKAGKTELNNLPTAQKTAFFPEYSSVLGISDVDIENFVNLNYQSIFR